jgi:1-phosphofructokinase
MIITVTMNPAVDKTAMIPALVPHGLNRLRDVVQDVGGKGINVSKTIAALGGNSLATGLLAGATGKMIWNTLQQMEGVEPRFLFVEGQTRTNLKLVEPNGMLTELNEQGPTVTEAARLALVEQSEQMAQPGVLFVIAGSVSGGVPAEFYRSLIERIHAKGATVFLDADGELFQQGVKACPDIIKPNAFELCQFFGRETAEESEIIAMGRELNRRGVGIVCVSMGAQGAVFIQKEHTWRAQGLKVNVRSSVGAGDAMVAAISYGLDQKLPMEQCLRLAVATSAATCTTEGTKTPSLHEILALEKQVQLHLIDE